MTKNEGLGDAQRAHANGGQQIALGRTDEEHAVFTGQLLEDLKDMLLRRAVEIDHQIAAEDDVVGHLGRQFGIEQVAGLKIDAATHQIGNLEAFAYRGEKTLAKAQVAATKRVLSVYAVLGACNRNRTDIDGIDLELADADTGIDQRHGNRVRLFTRRTRQAENA